MVQNARSDNAGIFYCVMVMFLLLLQDSHIASAEAEDRYQLARKEMIDAIEADVSLTSGLIDKTRFDPRVMEAMSKVPRHAFVPPEKTEYAYENRPLSIGFGQTISQPYIVALMTDLLDLRPDAAVLEIGTGSGYQAAVLSGLVKAVYTIEIIEALGVAAERRLKRLRYENVRTRISDGYYGWPEQAPFDGIIVTAAVGHIPPPLIRQLKAGGRMVIPVGSPFLIQHLTLVEKDRNGEVRTRQLLPVRFVPLTGGHP